MNFEEYKAAYYQRDPQDQKFPLKGMRAASLSLASYQQALDFYTQVFGPFHYKEGPHTHGWRLGDSWFTLFKADQDPSTGFEIALELESKAAVDQLTQAFLQAGAQGDPAEEDLMYEPVYVAFLTDPFGLAWSLIYTLPTF